DLARGGSPDRGVGGASGRRSRPGACETDARAPGSPAWLARIKSLGRARAIVRCGRRGARCERRRILAQPGPATANYQRVWPDRDSGWLFCLSDGSGVRSQEGCPDRTSDAEYTGLYIGPVVETGAGGLRWGVVHWGIANRIRVSEASGADL